MPKFLNAVAAMLLAAASLTTPKLAIAADAVQTYREEAGPCGDKRFLNKIVERFDYQVKHVPHLPQVSILDFQNIRENRYEPENGEIWPVERRYCRATVALSDGATATSGT